MFHKHNCSSFRWGVIQFNYYTVPNTVFYLYFLNSKYYTRHPPSSFLWYLPTYLLRLLKLKEFVRIAF